MKHHQRPIPEYWSTLQYVWSLFHCTHFKRKQNGASYTLQSSRSFSKVIPQGTLLLKEHNTPAHRLMHTWTNYHWKQEIFNHLIFILFGTTLKLSHIYMAQMNETSWPARQYIRQLHLGICHQYARRSQQLLCHQVQRRWKEYQVLYYSQDSCKVRRFSCLWQTWVSAQHRL